MTNWYVLHTLSVKSAQLVKRLNQKGTVEAFIPCYEYYRRSSKSYEIKPMFNGYVFVKSNLLQIEFNQFLYDMKEEKDGLIRQLKNKDASALRKQEIEMFEKLLDENHVVRISQVFLQDGKAKVISGPLRYFEKNIIKIDKHDRFAYLDLSFMDRTIKVGIELTSKE